MSKITLAIAKQQLAHCGMTITAHYKRDNEFRVNFADKDGTEDNAYYTDDIEDAVSTGIAMASARMMRSEDSWKTWPRLPLKQVKDDRLGCLIIAVTGNPAQPKFVVYEVNLFMDIQDDTPVQRYATEHEVVNAGWRVN